MKEMFEASVDGQAYDTERWGSYFRPAGVSAPAGTAESAPASVAVSKATPAPVSDFDDDEPPVATAPVAAPTATAPTQKAEDILAMIRARQQK
jgi:hypothetical protein